MTTKSKSQDKQKLTEIDDNISRLFEIKKVNKLLKLS